MKLLITGGTGFLGRRAVAFFKDLGFPVLSPSHGELDITDETSVRNWFYENKPDAVIHTAAISDTGLCQREPEWSETINVAGCLHLAEACREIGGKLVICSSDQVYSGSCLPGPHREDETVTPNNVYGNQKLRAERECLTILPETVCLRLSWMYARDSYPGEHGHFLTTLHQALEDKSRILTWPVHDRRGLTDVEDVIRNIPKTLELEGGIWNFGSGNDSSTYDTVKMVMEEMKMEEALRRLRPNEEAFADAPRDLTMDQTKLNGAGIAFPTTKEGLCLALMAER